jgi:hypothetical protein
MCNKLKYLEKGIFSTIYSQLQAPHTSRNEVIGKKEHILKYVRKLNE